MIWRDRLRKARFRGVEFWVAADETSIGRRVVFHEYPLRDIPCAQDLGRRGRRYEVGA